MTNIVRPTTIPTVISRRRALAALSGLGLAAVASAGTSRAVLAQEAGSGPGGPYTTAQDAAGPVVVASASGSASAPADRVLIQLIARSADYYGKGFDDASMSEPEAGTPVAGPTKELLQAAVDVLTAAGVDEGDILVVASDGAGAAIYFGAGAGMVGAELSGELLESLPEIVRDAAAALTEQGLMVDRPTAAYLADGCSDLRADALTAAVAAAREDAAALAAALGVEVTTLHRATEQGYAFTPYAYGGTGGDGCDALPELADLARTYLSPYDPTAPLELMVTANIELTMNVAPRLE